MFSKGTLRHWLTRSTPLKTCYDSVIVVNKRCVEFLHFRGVTRDNDVKFERLSWLDRRCRACVIWNVNSSCLVLYQITVQ